MSFPVRGSDKIPELPIKNKRFDSDGSNFARLRAPNKYKRIKEVVKQHDFKLVFNPYCSEIVCPCGGR